MRSPIRPVTRRFSGWGRGVSAVAPSYRPQGTAEIADALDACRRSGQSVTVRGGGRSYGDSALPADGVVLDLSAHTAVSAGPGDGEVTARSGTRLRDLLAYVLKDGRMLGGIPGSPDVSVGGAIGHSVHGKDAHLFGDFANNVVAMTVLFADGTIQRLDRSADETRWQAIVGGMGLTGVILEATVTPFAIDGEAVAVRQRKFSSIRDLPPLFDEAENAGEMAVAWVDGFTSRGRGILETGRWVRSRDAGAGAPFGADRSSRLGGLFGIGLGMVNNRALMRALNHVHYTLSGRSAAETTVSADGFLFPIARRFPNHYRLFPGGLYEMQVFVPAESFIDFYSEIVTTGRRSGCESWLAGVKRHRPDPHVMSFSGQGYSITIDLPGRTVRSGVFPAFLDHLAATTARAGGHFNPSKDAVLTAGQFEATCHWLDHLLAVKHELDPSWVLSTGMGRRLVEPLYRARYGYPAG